jgi:hypothetical protein
MQKRLVGLAAALALCASVSHADTPAPTPDTCEVACTYRQGDGPKRIVSCYERTDARQCTAIADHKNINDAYPAKMSCAAKLVPICKEAREF